MRKQINKIIAGLFMFILCISAAAGCSCGDKTIASLKIKEGTFEYAYMEDTQHSFDNIKVIVTYNDGSTAEVGKGDLTISPFSTENVGTYPVRISYGDKYIDVNLKVINSQEDLYDIRGVHTPDSITLREGKIAAKENYEVEFYDRDEVYVVGDDNPFVFFPTITALNENDDRVTINSYKSVATLYIKNNDDTFTKVADDQVANYVAIDDMAQTYDFVDGAITNGKTFKLEVRPFWLTEEQLETVADYTESLTFKVVDGYNVHEAKELVVMTNYTHDEGKQTVADADTFLSNNQITKPNNINGIVLHNDLNITQADLPTQYFVTEGNKTYLKDYIDLYSHKVATGETFTFYGNYFNVSVESLPEVKIADKETSHSTLFRLTSDAGVDEATVNTAKSYIYNASFIGNANRSEDETATAGIAGLMLLKAENHTTEVDNCLMRTFFIHLMTDRWDETTLNINHVKSYDSYQNSLFVWGGTVNLTNSEFKRAGGPLMILQHRDVDDYNGDPANDAIIDLYAPDVNVDNNTVLESFITGAESWFATMGASTTATLLTALSQTFADKGMNYVKKVLNDEGQLVPAMNLIAVNMSAGETFEKVVLGSSKALGSVVINDKAVVSKYADNMAALEDGVEYAIKLAVAEGVYAQTEATQAGTFAALSQGLGTAGLNVPLNNAADLVAAFENEQVVTVINGHPAFADAAYILGMYNTKVAENLENVPTVMAAAPLFQSTAGGVGFIQGPALSGDSINPNDYSLVSTGSNLFTGNYIGMYYLGLGITLGYYSTAA